MTKLALLSILLATLLDLTKASMFWSFINQHQKLLHGLEKQ